MKLKTNFTLIISALFLLFAVFYGLMMYQKIWYNKGLLSINLSTYIPPQSTSVLQINRPQGLEHISPFVGEMRMPVAAFRDQLTYPFYIINVDSDMVVISKLEANHEISLRNKIQKGLYPTFPPKKLKYKGAELLFYTTNNNKFFVCMFYKGIFAASYNYKLLEQIVNTPHSSNFFSDNAFKKLKGKMRDEYFANLYVSSDSNKSAYNLSFTTHLNLSGYLVNDKQIERFTADTLASKFDPAIAPKSFIAFNMSKDTDLDPALQAYFEPLSYTFYLSQDTCLNLIKLKKSESTLMRKLEQMGMTVSGSKLRQNRYLNKLEYTTSKPFTKQILGEDRILFFTFSRGCFVYSAYKGCIDSYIQQKTSSQSSSLWSLTADKNSFFYTRNCTKVIPHYISTMFKSFQAKDSSSIIIQTQRDDSFTDIDLSFQ